MNYYTRTVRISANKINDYDIDKSLDKEVNWIYSQEDLKIVNMTITPVIGTHEGLRVVDEYWIVYVYCGL